MHFAADPCILMKMDMEVFPAGSLYILSSIYICKLSKNAVTILFIYFYSRMVLDNIIIKLSFQSLTILRTDFLIVHQMIEPHKTQQTLYTNAYMSYC